MDPAGTTRVLVPLARLRSFHTAVEDFFVVAHMGIARLGLEGWTLRVEGAVERPRALGYAELLAMPARSLTAVHECFGNPVEPDAPTRRVANVTWLGVPLREVLEPTGIHAAARSVWLEAPDWGSFAGASSDHYVKDLPLDKALDPDTLLAHTVNGAPLTPEHGFPVRVVAPGFFGTNSVKWLTRVYLSDRRPEGLFTTRLYNREVRRGDRVEREPVRELDVQAVIVDPAAGDAVVAGWRAVRGWAWSAVDVARVEWSADGGLTWGAARLEPRRERHAWQRFDFDWQAAPGERELRCRATDARGRVQLPSGRNRIHVVTVRVGAA
jgi:DMSO/TMAO reductase YedYZ molybdopterin-dependent catalytic subunit